MSGVSPTRLWVSTSRLVHERRRALPVCGSLVAFAAVAVVLAGRWDQFAVALAGAPLGILAVAAALQMTSLLRRSESWCMPAELGAIPAPRRRLIELSYFGGLTHIQLARLLPSPA